MMQSNVKSSEILRMDTTNLLCEWLQDLLYDDGAKFIVLQWIEKIIHELKPSQESMVCTGFIA
tara:strand:- start:380 stop:568 length:189 start_codon:yes stop_codon:yes gene_type:complete